MGLHHALHRIVNILSVVVIICNLNPTIDNAGTDTADLSGYCAGNGGRVL